jgi:organic hydroperoxide reductase OsmC/OhrA
MAQYTAEILWERGEQDFLANTYSRRHSLRFDGGAEVPGSSSPHVVPLPMSDASAVDPEEMFVASLSNCHMLWFLTMAVKRKFVVDRYFDAAERRDGEERRRKDGDDGGHAAPAGAFSGASLPTREQIEHMHHRAHEECFIANSVKTEVRCEPVY